MLVSISAASSKEDISLTAYDQFTQRDVEFSCLHEGKKKG